MKITKTRLKQIIKEELGRVVKESNFTDAYTFTGPGKDAAPRPHPLGKDYGDKVEITKIMQYLVRAGVIPEMASIDDDTPITMSPGMTRADAEAALNDESPYNFSKSASPEVKQRVLARLVQRKITEARLRQNIQEMDSFPTSALMQRAPRSNEIPSLSSLIQLKPEHTDLIMKLNDAAENIKMSMGNAMALSLAILHLKNDNLEPAERFLTK